MNIELIKKLLKRIIKSSRIHKDAADLIIMYFAPETQSPVTLLELGLFARSGRLVVCCPEGFRRKGNVDIVCNKYGVQQVNTIGEIIQDIYLKSNNKQ